METIAKPRALWVQIVGAAIGSVLAVVSSQFGLSVSLVGLALALVIFYFTFGFTAGPLDARGTRVRVAFICLALLAWLVAAFAVVWSLVHGHWI
jgi:hypothetical protein